MRLRILQAVAFVGFIAVTVGAFFGLRAGLGYLGMSGGDYDFWLGWVACVPGAVFVVFLMPIVARRLGVDP